MPKDPTLHSRYPSRYSPNVFVTPAQYICEFVCENAARKQKKDLPIKFWEIPAWSKFFRSQVRVVNALLTTYPDYVIIRVLRNNFNIISLRPKWVHEIIEQENLFEKQKQPKNLDTPINKRLSTEKPRKEFTTNKMSMRKMLDG